MCVTGQWMDPRPAVQGWASASFPPSIPRAPEGRSRQQLDGIWEERCRSVTNRQGTSTVGHRWGRGGKGGTWLHCRSCRRGFQGWLRAATNQRGLGNSREAQWTPLGRNPRKKLCLLSSKNTGSPRRTETKGNF